MNFKLILRFLGKILVYYSAILLIPALIANYYNEPYTPFLISAAISLVTGILFHFLKPESEVFRYKEGLAIVGMGWFLISIFGSLPYIMSGVHPVDSFFESMSGFTTTGATIFDKIEELPKSIIFWRSFTQWLGGMGIIALFVAIFPAMAGKSETLFYAEYPGVTLEKLKPRLEDTAMILYGIYLFYTLLEFAILYLLGVPAFESINHSFTTLSTGGFSSHTASISYYNSAAIDSVIVIFMMIAGTNFALHYYLLSQRRGIYKDPEFKAYIFIFLIASISIILLNLKTYNIFESIRYSVFQVVSIATTTGYTTADFDTWSSGAKIILLTLMFIGGSSGSTAGGIKVLRIYLLVKYSIIQILKVAEPRTARTVKFGDKAIQKNILDETIAFFILFIMIFAVSSIILSLSDYDLVTSFSSVAACLGNIGPALGLAGASESYSFFSYHVKIILALDMWIGRLEIFTVLALFMPQFWMKKW